MDMKVKDKALLEEIEKLVNSYSYKVDYCHFPKGSVAVGYVLKEEDGYTVSAYADGTDYDKNGREVNIVAGLEIFIAVDGDGELMQPEIVDYEVC